MKEKWKYMIYNLTCKDCKKKFSITLHYDLRKDIHRIDDCRYCWGPNVIINNQFVAWIEV